MASRGWERDGDPARRDNAWTESFDAAPPTQDGEDDAGSAAVPVVPPKRRRNLLRESHLVSAEGFKKLHRTFPYQLSAHVAGRETQALAQLVKLYKQWAFDLYPSLNFEDFVERTEALGKGHEVQALMTELREQERIKSVKKREEDDEKEKKSARQREDEEAML